MITELMKKGIAIIYQSKTDLVIHANKLIDTLFYMQSLGWHLDRIDDKDQLLYYYR